MFMFSTNKVLLSAAMGLSFLGQAYAACLFSPQGLGYAEGYPWQTSSSKYSYYHYEFKDPKENRSIKTVFKRGDDLMVWNDASYEERSRFLQGPMETVLAEVQCGPILVKNDSEGNQTYHYNKKYVSSGRTAYCSYQIATHKFSEFKNRKCAAVSKGKHSVDESCGIYKAFYHSSTFNTPTKDSSVSINPAGNYYMRLGTSDRSLTVSFADGYEWDEETNREYREWIHHAFLISMDVLKNDKEQALNEKISNKRVAQKFLKCAPNLKSDLF
jgi:hypothetical protein